MKRSKLNSNRLIHSGLSGLKEDQKWRDVQNFRFAKRRTTLVPPKKQIHEVAGGDLHTLLRNGRFVYAIGATRSQLLRLGKNVETFPLWRVSQEYLGDNTRPASQQRLFTRGCFTGTTPQRIRLTYVAGRLVPDYAVETVADPPEDIIPEVSCLVGSTQLGGTVLDIADDSPIANATVQILAQNYPVGQFTTDANGEWGPATFNVGLYTIDITALGYRHYTAGIDLVTTMDRVDKLTAALACGTLQDSGGQGYEEYEVNLGTGTGTVVLTFDTINIPDKFTIEWDGEIVLDTGYRGNSSYNAALFTATGEYVTGAASGTASFEKNKAEPTNAIVRVYAPLDSTLWSFTLGCPT